MALRKWYVVDTWESEHHSSWRVKSKHFTRRGADWRRRFWASLLRPRPQAKLKVMERVTYEARRPNR